MSRETKFGLTRNCRTMSKQMGFQVEVFSQVKPYRAAGLLGNSVRDRPTRCAGLPLLGEQPHPGLHSSALARRADGHQHGELLRADHPEVHRPEHQCRPDRDDRGRRDLGDRDGGGHLPAGHQEPAPDGDVRVRRGRGHRRPPRAGVPGSRSRLPAATSSWPACCCSSPSSRVSSGP